MRAVGAEAAALMARLRVEAGVEPVWSAGDFAQLLVLPTVHALVAEVADVPVGYVLFSLAAGEAEIYDIAIHLDRRRAGLGRALLGAAMDALRQAGARDLHLEVAEDNLAARALYDSSGFRISGRRRGYYRRQAGGAIDALVMSCRL